MSAARSTSPQLPSSNEAWWNLPFTGWRMKATSCALFEQVRKAPIISSPLRHHLLGQAEAQHLGEQLDRAVEIVAVQQAVVEARRRDALQVVRPGVGIDVGHRCRSCCRPCSFSAIQLHHVAGRDREAKALAGLRVLAGRDPLQVARTASTFRCRPRASSASPANRPASPCSPCPPRRLRAAPRCGGRARPRP